MKKLIIITTLGSLVFGASLDRRVELLENAVVKLIDENKKLKDKIDELKKTSKINTQMIFALNNRVSKNETSVNKLNRGIAKANEEIIKINKKLKENNTTFYAQINTAKLNIREKPTTKSKIVGILKKGTIIKIKGSKKTKKTIWYEIDNNKFISSTYTNLIKGEKK